MADEAPLVTGTPEATQEPAIAATIATGTETVQDPVAAAMFTADNWRTELSGGDEKVLKTLERYTDPKAAAKALYETKRMVSSGEYRKPLSKEATPEEVSAWRKENGIPDAFDKYEVKLGNGLTIGEDEKPFIDEFLKAAHGANSTPEQVNGILSWYYDTVQKREEEMHVADNNYRREAEDALRSEWGGDYRPNINLITSLFDQAPEGLKDNMLSARTADGKLLGDHPDFIKFMVGLAREVNPIATVVPGAGANAGMAIDEELGKLTKLAGDYDSEYWKGPNSANLQKRMDDLLAAKARMK